MKQAILRKTATQELSASPRIANNNVVDHSSAAIAQKKRMEMLANSPQATAQRERMNTLQRVEEEEPLQGKFETAQRVEEEEPLQGKFETAQRVEEEEPLQGKFGSGATDTQPQQAARANNTGLPDNLKSGIESLSGMSMDNVKVHYNSSQPAQLQALAYAQGNDIHVGPGQEQHLPHEAWHVVQQRQGRVQPTMQMKGGVPVNDDSGLEEEADVMGAKALQAKSAAPAMSLKTSSLNAKPVAQRLLRKHAVRADEGEIYTPASGPGFINMYQLLMAQDSTVLVEGSPGGEKGVQSVLKATEVDGGAVKSTLVDSIMASKSWMLLGNEDAKKSLAAYVMKANDLPEEETDTPDSIIKDVAPDYSDAVQEWVEDRLKALDEATTVGQIASAGIAIEWHEDLAQIVYDATKATYYPEALREATPFVPPFKELISDVNNDRITEFKYVRKYGEHTVPGAEFTVEKPVEKKAYYLGKAVLHTHYDALSEAPNYAHTKPYEQRFASGYGYTIVNLPKIKAINDSKKKWDAL